MTLHAPADAAAKDTAPGAQPGSSDQVAHDLFIAGQWQPCPQPAAQAARRPLPAHRAVMVRENTEGEYSEIGGRLHQGRPGEIAIKTRDHYRPGIGSWLRPLSVPYLLPRTSLRRPSSSELSVYDGQ
jgi:hypothetical protein